MPIDGIDQSVMMATTGSTAWGDPIDAVPTRRASVQKLSVNPLLHNLSNGLLLDGSSSTTAWRSENNPTVKPHYKQPKNILVGGPPLQLDLPIHDGLSQPTPAALKPPAWPDDDQQISVETKIPALSQVASKAVLSQHELIQGTRPDPTPIEVRQARTSNNAPMSENVTCSTHSGDEELALNEELALKVLEASQRQKVAVSKLQQEDQQRVELDLLEKQRNIGAHQHAEQERFRTMTSDIGDDFDSTIVALRKVAFLQENTPQQSLEDLGICPAPTALGTAVFSTSESAVVTIKAVELESKSKGMIPAANLATGDDFDHSDQPHAIVRNRSLAEGVLSASDELEELPDHLAQELEPKGHPVKVTLNCQHVMQLTTNVLTRSQGERS